MAPIPLSDTKTDPSALLQDLVQLNYDALEAYKAALRRLHDDGARSMLEEFVGDHDRHTEELGTLIRGLGDEPPRGPGGKRFLTKAKVMLSDPLGDKGILRAMRSNAHDLNEAYEEALHSKELPPEIRDALSDELEDERRHRARIDQVLEAL